MESISESRITIVIICRNVAITSLSFYEVKFKVLKDVLRNSLVEWQQIEPFSGHRQHVKPRRLLDINNILTDDFLIVIEDEVRYLE